MILFFFFYLIILILPGETIFQLSFLKKKEKILQFSIIEHLIYVIILGLSVSSIICLILAIFRVLSLFFLILIDLGIFFISIFLNIFNKNPVNEYILIIRIINYFKSKGNISFIKIIKGYYATIFSTIFFFLIYFLILINFKYISIPDVWYFSQWSIDIIKYSPDILYSTETINWYLGEIFYIKFQNFYLTIFILFDVEIWQIIVQYILPFIPLICLYLFIINFTINKTNQKKYIPILLLFSSYFLLNWFFYTLPISFSIILGLLFINSSFEKNKRSYVLLVFLAIYMYLFHSITTGLFAISFFFSLILLFFYNKEKKREVMNFLKKNRIVIIIFTIIITIFTLIFLYYFSSQIFGFFIGRVQINLTEYDTRAVSPTIKDWIGSNVGIHILIISILAIIFISPIIRNKKKKYLNNLEIQNKKIYILLFFWVLLIEIITICLFFPIWFLLSGIPYLFYRYFIYLDLACIFLAPYSFRYLMKYIQALKISKKRKKRCLIIFKSSFLVSTLIFIWIHSTIKYNLRIPYQYVPEKFIDTIYWLRDNTPSDSIYFVSPYKNGIILYQFQHCIMDDRIFINESLGNLVFNDSLYVNGFADNYNITFRDYIFEKEKPIDNRWALFPENYTNKKVNYIITNDYNNFYLTDLLLKDSNSFRMIRSALWIDELFGINYTIYVFQTLDL